MLSSAKNCEGNENFSKIFLNCIRSLVSVPSFQWEGEILPPPKVNMRSKYQVRNRLNGPKTDNLKTG